MRKPLDKWFPAKTRASGSHKGIHTHNVPYQIYQACSDGERIDGHLYYQLATEIDVDGLFDILEMKEVLESWKNAAIKNIESSDPHR